MELSKKGFIFTIISVTLLLATIFTTTVLYHYKYVEKASIIETRVDTMDDFLKDLEDDMGKGIHVAGFRSVVGLLEFMTQNGSFIDDFDTRFEEAFMTGQVYNQSSFIIVNNTFTDWMDKMAAQAEQIGITVEFMVQDVTVDMVDPWDIGVTLDIVVMLSDPQNIARWSKRYNVTSTFSIISFEDPLYTIKTGNAVTKRINMTIYEGNYVNAGDTTNLERHMNRTLYAVSNASPSYIMRFTGDFSPSPYGIESLVNKEEISTYWPCSAGTSNVDSLYFQCASTSTWSVSGMPSSFYLDNETVGSTKRHVKYQVGGLV